MAEDVRGALDAWYEDMDDAWALWLEGRERFRALTGRLVGAPKNLIIPKTSAGQGLRAVLNSFTTKPRVLTTDGEFDSLDFILRVYRRQGRIELKIVPWRDLEPTRRGSRRAVHRHVPHRRGGEASAEAHPRGARRRRAGAARRLSPCRRAAARPHRARSRLRRRRLVQVHARRTGRVLALRATRPGRHLAHARHRLVREEGHVHLRAPRAAGVRPRRRRVARVHAAGAGADPGARRTRAHARARRRARSAATTWRRKRCSLR